MSAVRPAVRTEPLPDTAALLLEDEMRWIVVADLHMGIEVQLRAAGFNIPSQTPRMLSALEGLRERADGLIVLGDLKHRIPNVGYRENKEIGPFLSRLAEAFKHVIVAVGNHDGGISSVLPEGVRAYSGRGFRIGPAGLFHGHVWPSADVMRARKIVMGHVHPSILLVDSLGTKTNEKCWVRANLNDKVVRERFDSCPDELIIVPAFNPLLTGTPVNAGAGSRIGPFFRNGLVDEERIQVFLLDGANLGHPLKGGRRRPPPSYF